MASYTQHYQLHQWEPGDDFLRTDFNADFQKIDAAIGELLAFGSYTGSGTASQTVNLGFTPRALYTCTQDGKAGSDVGSGYCYGGLAFENRPVTHNSQGVVTITTDGFRVDAPNDYARTNQSGEIYYYAAVR